MDIKIAEKRKIVKESQQQRKTARSHRHDVNRKSMKGTWKDLNNK